MNRIYFEKTLLKLGLTQWQVARRLGWSPEKLSHLKRGWRTARLADQVYLSHILGVPREKLFPAGGTEE